MSVFVFVMVSSVGQIGMWVMYYWIGSGEGCDLFKVVWDEYQLDVGLICCVGKLIVYYICFLCGDFKVVEEVGE